MEEVKIVVLDNGRLMAQFDDGTLVRLGCLAPAESMSIIIQARKRQMTHKPQWWNWHTRRT